VNFRRFLSPEAIDLDLETKLLPEGDLPEGFDPMSRQNLNRIREGVIGELSGLLAATGEVTHPQRLLRDLFNREKKAGTAVGQGVAFPHVRTLQVKSFVMAFGRSREGLPFDAPDEEPVRLFFAMAAPPYDDRTYLKVYRSLASLLLEPEHREQFLTAEDPSEILRALELVR
jgi:mannitol/fructose-specific phosphotransferase system IIA component (Ntr-type)